MQIAKRPQVAPTMVKDAVQNNTNVVRMQGSNEICQRLVVAKASIDLVIVGGVVAVPTSRWLGLLGALLQRTKGLQMRPSSRQHTYWTSSASLRNLFEEQTLNTYRAIN